MVELAAQTPGPALESFLATVLAREEDAGVRSVAATTLGTLAAGDRVNLETDVLAKYVERLLPGLRSSE